MTHRRPTSDGLLVALLIATTTLVAAIHPFPASADHSQVARVSLGAINGNGAYHAEFAGTSADGSRVFFETKEPLVAADTDAFIDVYERSGGTTTLVSTGSLGGNGAFNAPFQWASSDGSKVFFYTFESLEPTDTDASADVYERSNGVTTQVSVGAINGNGLPGAHLAFASDAGSRVVFETSEKLTLNDLDTTADLYQRMGGVTTLLSPSPSSSSGNYAAFAGASKDGGRVFFESNEKLVDADKDTKQDVYQRFNGVTTLISVRPERSRAPGAIASYLDASDSGSRVFFHTKERLVLADADSSSDIYERFGKVTRLVTDGAINGNGPYDVEWGMASTDGLRFYFETPEQLVPGDTDDGVSVYERAGSTTTLISGYGLESLLLGLSDDGAHVYFNTYGQLVPEDTDDRRDIYEYTQGMAKLVSAGLDGPGIGMSFGGSSSDGSRVFFVTDEKLTADDTDNDWDVFERAGGVTSLVSKGVATGNAPLHASFAGASEDGSRVFFESWGRFTADDTDDAADVYVAAVETAGFAQAVVFRSEGRGDVMFAVELDNPPLVPVTVEYRAVAGTAKRGADYSLAGGSLTFAPGETSKTIVLRLKQDFLVEPRETVIVRLSNPVSTELGQTRLRVTIVDDEERVMCGGEHATIVGSDRADTISGTVRGDVIAGRGGSDTIRGRGGDDSICGMDGDDTLIAGSGADHMSGGAGDDACRGGTGIDALLPNAACESVSSVP